MSRKRLGSIDRDSVSEMRDVAERAAAERRGMAASKAPPIGKVAGSAARSIEDELLRLRRENEDLSGTRDLYAHAKSAGLVIEQVPLDDVDAHALTRDRRMLDKSCEAWEELKSSLRDRGQQTPIELSGRSSMSGKYQLVSGYRRLSALRDLYAETGDPQFSVVKALISGGRDRVDVMVAMIEENEIRQDISFYERGRICCLAAEQGVCATIDEAIQALFSRSSRNRRYKIRNFTVIHSELGAVLDYPEQIGERLGARLAQALKDGRGPALVAELSDRDTKFATAEEELAILTEFVAQQGRFAVAQAEAVPVLTAEWQSADGVKVQARSSGGRIALKLDGLSVSSAEELEAFVAQLADLLDGQGR
ncbi:ParB N-terminal domain-containing protein [Pseudoruegeria sp. SK021]|uniref:ParB/RepB/Spo0J family partition protein n=1 Tax=Pseudoruegeria sp. SK021 TaxID=1933035 RepID=UPI000A263B89|nr:ParB N-terminal domain-containing protein [Pseudoruegeria sp. SK021]OSP53556.1 hypothetical protein BV911_17290 [Pseudoruegeria sp. SK021]